VSVEPFHLQAYCDEQAFRFNNREMDDADRLNLTVKGIVGERITYAELTGTTEEAVQHGDSPATDKEAAGAREVKGRAGRE